MPAMSAPQQSLAMSVQGFSIQKSEIWRQSYSAAAATVRFRAYTRYAIAHLGFARSPLQRGVRSANVDPLRRSRYPNPGHLGSSSHVALFNQISSEGVTGAETITTANSAWPPQLQDDLSESVGSEILHVQLAQTLEMLADEFKIESLTDLVKFWLAKGASLALAEPIVLQCTESAEYFLAPQRSTALNHYNSLVQDLVRNSASLLAFARTSTLSDYIHQFCGQNIRLETIGIFVAAVIRASIDVPFFPPLYATESERYRLRQLLTTLANYALELCLSIDCLNDLQLIFQYEYWIVLSYVHGDQSRWLHRSGP
jgi:hypothetical protein